MPRPFYPGTVYYASVPDVGVYPNECRDNPAKGPRPWVIVFARSHRHSGLVIAAPLYSKRVASMATHVEVSPEDFEGVGDSHRGLFQDSWLRLEQLRALDKGRLDLTSPLGRMKKLPMTQLRANLQGMSGPYMRAP